MSDSIRINKYIATQGIASRREADALISAGKVRINGRVATLGDQVGPEDTVTVAKSKARKRYFAYYKGRGVITHSPAEHEVDIATKLATDYGLTDVYPIGRLDKDSEGLLILTDDGRITGPLLDPDRDHEREYDVTVDKPINQWFQRHLAEGVTIEGYRTKPAIVHPKRNNQKRFSLTITEGKKHQIRRMCAALGYQVTTLKRVRIMHIELGKLKPNQYRKLTEPEKTKLLENLDIKK